MLDKNDLLDAILNECKICSHLFTKIPDGGLEYRPTPKQRNTIELLRYLSFCGIGACRTMAANDWDEYTAVAERAKDMTAEEFPAAMARQKQELTEFFDGLTQEDVETRRAQTPMGEDLSLEQALVALPLTWMTAYRMQLFLYAKQAGNKDIWTPDCWAGVSMEKPTTPQEA